MIKFYNTTQKIDTKIMGFRKMYFLQIRDANYSVVIKKNKKILVSIDLIYVSLQF